MNARAIIIAAVLACCATAQARDWYVKPAAAGTQDGTSWANATTWAAAAAGCATGDDIYTDAPANDPFVGELELNGKTGVVVITDHGPNAVTYLDNRRNAGASWTDAGGGVYSLAMAAPPGAVLIDVQQDDLAGTVTGVEITPWQQMLLALWGIDPDEARAWYGFLKRDGVLSGSWTNQDSSPSDGTWTWTAGTLYVNPPGSPDEAEVETKLRYCPDDVQGWELVACDDCHLTGLTYVMFYSGWGNADGGGNGYGYAAFGNNSANCSIAGVHAHCAGWHGVGFAGAVNGGPNNTIRECFVNGCASNTSATAYVIYQPGPPNESPMGGHVGRDLVAMLTPPLDTDGVPIPPEASASPTSWGLTPYLSHSGGGVTTYGGIEWRRVLALDHTDSIEAKHTITNSTLGEFVQHTQGTVGDPADPTTFPVQVTDSAIVGRPYIHSNNQVHYDRCLFDRDGCGRSDLSWPLANGGSSNVLNVSQRRCTSILGDHSTDAIVNVGANDYVWIEDSVFYLQASTAQTALIELDNTDTPDIVHFVGNRVESDGSAAHSFLRGLDTTHATDGPIQFEQLGGNVFGDGLTYMAINNTVPSTSRDFAWWTANYPASPADVEITMPWGTAPQDVLRMLWLQDALQRAPFVSLSR